MPASRLTHWLLFGLALIVAVIGTALLLVDSRWGENRARRFIVSRASEALVGDLSIDRLSGSMLGGDVRLEGVTLTHEGVPVFSAEDVRLRYSLPQMISGVTIAEVIVTRPRVILVQDPETGAWNVTELTRGGDPNGSRPTFEIARLQVVDGQVEVRPREASVRRLAALDAQLGLQSTAEAFLLEIGQLSARDADTNLALQELSGDLRFADGRGEVTDLQIRTEGSALSGNASWESSPAAAGAGGSRADGLLGDTRVTFDLEGAPILSRELTPYVPALADIPASTSLTFDARGSLEDFTADWTLTSEEAGRASGQATGAARASRLDLNGSVETEQLDPSQWMDQPELAGDLNVSGTFEAAVPLERTSDALHVDFDATLTPSRLAGYRIAGATATGRYADDALTASVSARAYGAAADLDGRWHATTRRWQAEGRFSSLNVSALPARLRAPRLTSDLSGRVRAEGGESTWAVDAVLAPSTVEGAQIADGFAAAVASDGATIAYDVTGSVRGLDPRPFTALLEDPPEIVGRLDGVINADLRLKGRGTALDSAVADGEIWLHDSSLPGVVLDETHVTAALANGTLEATLEAGRLAVTENPLGFETGPIEAAGTAAVHVVVPRLGEEVPIDAIEADGTVTISGARARGATLDRAQLVATLQHGLLRVAELQVAGPGGTAEATGVVALAGQGSSDLTFRISASDLAAFGGFTDQPLAGGATVAGRVTGPARHPSASGTIEAHDLTAGPAAALSFAGDFTATLPELSMEQASGTIDATATFVEISGTRLDELIADVEYDAGRVVLDATLAQGPREFEIAGELVPHPDHREVHLQRLALGAGGAIWQIPAGQEAVIQYAPDRVNVKNLALVSGDGFLRVDGTFGEGSEAPLMVVAENVRLQDLNQMALGTHTFEGSLDMTAEVTGTTDAPIVRADLAVDGGSIDGQPFQSLTGSGGFRDHQITLDLEMDAGTFGRLTAAGTLPLAAGAPEGTVLAPYDVTVRSTALDLTFLQPLTSVVEQIGGTASVDVRVEGAADAPAVNGTVGLSEVTFRVPATGVTYQRLNADLTVRGQQLIVEQLALEDSEGNPATVQGALDLPGLGDQTGFELIVSTDELFVLRNELGEIAVTADLQALGDLQTPLLAGTITVDRGLVEVSDLLERLSSSGYEAAPAEAATDTAEASPYMRSSLSVTLAIPGNLVVRGRDLRGGSGPIGLGDVNVTLDGALLVAKETGEEPTLIGAVDVVRGQYDFQGRQFTILRGSEISFQGTPANPALDISAERLVSGVTATVHLGGTLARPEIALSSNPMLDQGDILSLIVFNQPMNSLATTERVSLGARAAALAASAIATPLADSVARALDLDVFEIEPTAAAGGGASVRIGRQVGDNLFLGVSQEFGREDVTQVSFEFRLNEYISIITSVAHGSGGQTNALRRAQEAGIDLIYTTR